MDEANIILSYWFYKHYRLDVIKKLMLNKKPLWFNSTPQIDNEISENFSDMLKMAGDGKYNDWITCKNRNLAYIILCDQFPRHIFRNKAEAFSYDERALDICLYGLDHGFDKHLNIFQKYFFYLPLMHSENKNIQMLSKVYYDDLIKGFFWPPKVKKFVREFVYRHKEIIDRFGRYPHRNEALGRISSAEELAFLKEPMSSF
ncbi:DUF924 family protein [uncultured Shewanella sp.]|uniref:DUF924 family protein n=1 Tax=uncultured Shewanella sp. TaxID=173975 RepID=UPI002623989B|nr:DUF924 family protein [uncultured Shewanella sp.]